MGTDRHQWDCAEAGHPRPPRPGTCTEVVNVWLFPKLCPPAMQTGSCTHEARRCRRGRPVLTTHRVIGWGLSPGPATRPSNPTSCCLPTRWLLDVSGPGSPACCPHLAWPQSVCGAVCASVYVGGSGAAGYICKSLCEFLSTRAGALGAPGGVCLCVVHAPVRVAG